MTDKVREPDMASLLGEIKRRKIFQVAAAYVVVAWLLVQVITAIEAPLNLPDWFDTAVIVLLGIGFPITMVMSWAFNLTSDGLVRDAGTSTPTVAGGRSIEQVLIGLLVVAVGWLLFQDMRPDSETIPAAATSSTVAPTGATVTAETATQPERLPNSIAILPFESMSPNPNDAFFARGIHEEILNKLANLRNLNVIARTSVLQYEGAQRPITEIAGELNVGTIMEGSVSYADNRVAVSAQLIDGTTGLHIWSDRYYGELENVFEIQADIAMNIANALEAEFSTTEQARITELPTESFEAYTLYLQALDTDDTITAGRLIDEATRLDPRFALAYAFKAQVYALRGRGELAISGDAWETVVREAAERAIELDPRLAAPYAALASIHHANWRWSEAELAYSAAYEINPKDSAVLEAYATLKRDMGDYPEAIRLFRLAREFDPGRRSDQLGIAYRYAGDYAEAIALHRENVEKYPGFANSRMQLAFAEIGSGNSDAGLRELQTAERLGIGGGFWRNAQVALAYRHLGRRDDVERVLAPVLEAETQPVVDNSVRAVARLALADYESAREYLEAALTERLGQSLPLLSQIKANDYADPMLDTPEWQALRDRIGAP